MLVICFLFLFCCCFIIIIIIINLKNLKFGLLMRFKKKLCVGILNILPQHLYIGNWNLLHISYTLNPILKNQNETKKMIRIFD
jgi:hypothetical protein